MLGLVGLRNLETTQSLTCGYVADANYESLKSLGSKLNINCVIYNKMLVCKAVSDT